MLQVEDAQARIAAAFTPLPREFIPLHESAGRVLAEPLIAPLSLPPFDNSAMDGYALRAADVAAARANSPVTLRRIAAVAAGATFEGTVEPGTCVRLFTGSPLPSGADAVVMQEDTRAEGEKIAVLDAVKPWENVRLAGEDVKRGEVIAQAGTRLSAGTLALCGALGIARVPVGARPVIGVLGTGNELVEPGVPLAPGQIYESNRLVIATLVEQTGARAKIFPLVRDTPEATRDALKKAFAECDAVVTSGGVSVGEHDLVKAAFESLGGVVDFWRVAMKPGKPFVFGKLGGKFLLGLPGNPVSAFVTFLLLVRPAILRLQGATDFSLPSSPAVLAEPLHNRGDRRHFLRVRVDAQGRVWSTGPQASHALASLARANGLVDVPPDTYFAAGVSVRVLALGFDGRGGY